MVTYGRVGRGNSLKYDPYNDIQDARYVAESPVKTSASDADEIYWCTMRVQDHEKRSYVRNLHSYAGDLSVAATSPRLDRFFGECCHHIAQLVGSIPKNEISAKQELSRIVSELLQSSDASAKRSPEDITRRRSALASSFVDHLNDLYPQHLHIETSSYSTLHNPG